MSLHRKLRPFFLRKEYGNQIFIANNCISLEQKGRWFLVGQDENSGKKIYIVDGVIELRFAVAATTPLEAEQEARRRVSKSMETEAFGTVGWSFTSKKVQEAKPISR